MALRQEHVQSKHRYYALDHIIESFLLKCFQAVHQLRNWKAEQYNNSQAKIFCESGNIKQLIYDSISANLDDCVMDFWKFSMRRRKSWAVAT